MKGASAAAPASRNGRVTLLPAHLRAGRQVPAPAGGRQGMPEGRVPRRHTKRCHIV